MIVVADASPLNYLVQLGLQDVTLPLLYGSVFVPRTVHDELLDTAAPAVVQRWATKLPTWVHVRNPAQVAPNEVSSLDKGEAAALTLALELGADVVLMDELRGRRIASQQLGLLVAGTLGVLRDAHQRGALDGRQALVMLCSTTSFRYDTRLINEYLSQLT